MDKANQVAAYGFLVGEFGVPSWVLKFNTLHSCPLAVASPVTDFPLTFITAVI
jgi:hypothetical protein